MKPSARPSILLRAGRLAPGLLFVTLILFVGAVVNFVVEGPNRGPLLGVAILLPFLVVRLAVVAHRDRIDGRLEALLADSFPGYRVVAQDFPDYRFVDVFRAIATEIAGPATETLDSAHIDDLGSIIKGAFTENAGLAREPSRFSRAVEPSRSEYFPTERFWVRKKNQDGRTGLVARLRHLEYAATARLEVASRDLVEAERTVSTIRDTCISSSIYRGKSVEISFAAGVKDEFGNIDQSGKVKVDFRRSPRVARDDIVLDPRIWPIVEHTLIDLHRNRLALRECGVALKRGLLFYGPPGTGKSFTCCYIASLLPETTVVHCTGGASRHVSSVFNLARMLKPSLIVMEDVDLVFASRDINTHGAVLGDLFDQIDALADDEPITMILTTNAIERVELAVKDRPGRVSQCVFFGPPSPELRERYLLSFLRNHEYEHVDLGQIVRDTEGATQVFLKELVNRALQFAVEAGRTAGSRVKPSTGDFVAALAEIRTFDGKAVRNVTGFRVEVP